MSNTYWFDKPQLAELEGVMLTGVRAISKSEAVDIMNKQQEQINRFVDKVISQQEKIDALTQDKHAIITNHLNVLAECIMAVPVPERDREANIKMRDAILNVMASSVAAYQVDSLSPHKPSTKPSHSWNDDLSTCTKCGDKDWMADEFCSESLLVKPITYSLDARFTCSRQDLVNDNGYHQQLKK